MNKIKLLITAGPTYEKIDPVRFIGNYSSGKMGFALARAAAERGAEVTLVAGPVSLPTPHEAVRRIDVESALEMYDAAMSAFPEQDAAILCAAVADYRPAEQATSKIKRKESEMVIRLVANPDIAASLGAVARTDQTLAGFALETDNARAHAADKLRRKRLDFIVLNSLSDEGAGFRVDTNRISTLRADGSQTDFPLKTKAEVAEDIIDELFAAIEAKRGGAQ